MSDRENGREPDPAPGEFQVVDRRKFLNLDVIDKAAPVEPKPRYPSYVEELRGRMEEMEKRFREKTEQVDGELARTRARLREDFDRKLELEKGKLVLPFLEVLDNLERAMEAAARADSVEHLLEGVRLTADLFRSKLQSIGVTPVPSLGLPFDPNSAQAVGTIPVTDAARDGVVLEELQTGYAMGDQLVRPAQVRVGRSDT